MLKDLFFFIWHDDMGCGWLIFTVVLFLLSIAWVVYTVARTKALEKKLSKSSWIGILIALFLMYQIVPTCFDLLGMMSEYYQTGLEDKVNLDRSVSYEKLAIKTSIIPWQKGGYYIKLAGTYMMNKDYTNQIASLDKAYEYIKEYKYPCWGTAFLVYFSIGEYDKAIELSKYWRISSTSEIRPMYNVIARCYIMKGDLENAMLYTDKALEREKQDSKQYATTFALKGYLEKRKGNKENAEKFYKQALELAKDANQKELVEATYKDFYSYEQERLKKNLEKLNRG